MQNIGLQQKNKKLSHLYRIFAIKFKIIHSPTTQVVGGANNYQWE